MSTNKSGVRKTAVDSGDYHNHLKQQFQQKAPNLVCVSDITYLKANGKWYYLCIIIDLFSRKVISWTLASQINADLVLRTFQRAYEIRNKPKGLIFHSDGGSQYTSRVFRNLLDQYDVVQSFSKKGYPYDNACCESFFKYLKKERTDRCSYRSAQDLRLDLFDYIDGFYNNKRPHGSLAYLTPNRVEANYKPTITVR